MFIHVWAFVLQDGRNVNKRRKGYEREEHQEAQHGGKGNHSGGKVHTQRRKSTHTAEEKEKEAIENSLARPC